MATSSRNPQPLRPSLLGSPTSASKGGRSGRRRPPAVRFQPYDPSMRMRGHEEEGLTCSLAAKRKTALSRRRKSPCPEVHLAQQLEMSLTLSTSVAAASSEDEAEELDIEDARLLAAAMRRAGTEDTDTSASTGVEPSESGP